MMFFVLSVLTLIPGMQSFAASKTPGNVKKLTASASETSITLKWSKASKAKGYEIYQVDTNTGARKKIATTKKTSYTVKKLRVNQTYTYQVFGYQKVKNKTYRSESGSPLATAKTYVFTPAAAGKVRVDTYGNLSITFKWDKGKKASGYYIYRYDEAKKDFVLIATTTKTSYTISNLTEGTAVRLKIQSYRKVQGVTVNGKISGEVSGTARGYSNATKSVLSKRYNVTLKSDTTVTIEGTTTKKTIKKGTSMVALSAGGTNVRVILSNGTTTKIARSRLKYHNLKTTKTEYSRSVKEAFVNEKGYSSRTSYLIWINQYTLNTSIFRGSKGHWKLVRSMPCVVGKMGKTPTGTFRLCRRDYAYGGPRVYFTWNAKKSWGNSFHRRVDGTTRAAASHGCIRLSDSDLNYLVGNCSMGTTVVSY